jgi:hypothetical protein
MVSTRLIPRAKKTQRGQFDETTTACASLVILPNMAQDLASDLAGAGPDGPIAGFRAG